jgi:DNA-binding XRE family transcriptional regulator
VADNSEQNIGNRVRELRRMRLMTQSQLARKAKVALRTIHSIEQGKDCRLDTKRKLIRAFEVPLENKDQVFPSREARERRDAEDRRR